MHINCKSKPGQHGLYVSLVRHPTLLDVVKLMVAVILTTVTLPVLAESSWKSGAHAYQEICGYCHEAGVVGPVLKGRNLPPEFFIAMARNGFRAMPAFPESFIDDKSLRQLGEYLSTSTVEQPAASKK